MDFVSHAASVVSGIIDQLKEKANELIEAIFGDNNDGEEIDDPEEALAEVEDELIKWGEEYAPMVSETEITAVIEITVLGDLMDSAQATSTDNSVQERLQVYWVVEDEACKYCQQNADASPIPAGTAFPTGDMAPPAHPRCRCNISSFPA